SDQANALHATTTPSYGDVARYSAQHPAGVPSDFGDKSLSGGAATDSMVGGNGNDSLGSGGRTAGKSNHVSGPGRRPSGPIGHPGDQHDTGPSMHDGGGNGGSFAGGNGSTDSGEKHDQAHHAGGKI